MKITAIKTVVVNTEMRNWVFVKVETDQGGGSLAGAKPLWSGKHAPWWVRWKTWPRWRSAKIRLE